MNKKNFLLFCTSYSNEEQSNLFQEAINNRFCLYAYYHIGGSDIYVQLTRDQLLSILHSKDETINIFLTEEQIINNNIITRYTLNRLLETNDGLERIEKIKILAINYKSLFVSESVVKKTHKKKPNPLHKAIIRAYKHKSIEFGREPTVSEIWDVLMDIAFDQEELIQSQQEGSIQWIDRRGKQKTMTLKTVKNFISDYKKSLYFDQ